VHLNNLNAPVLNVLSRKQRGNFGRATAGLLQQHKDEAVYSTLIRGRCTEHSGGLSSLEINFMKTTIQSIATYAREKLGNSKYFTFLK